MVFGVWRWTIISPTTNDLHDERSNVCFNLWETETAATNTCSSRHDGGGDLKRPVPGVAVCLCHVGGVSGIGYRSEKQELPGLQSNTGLFVC